MLILSLLSIAARSIWLLLLAALAGILAFRASAATKRVIWIVSLLTVLAMPVVWRFSPRAIVYPNQIPGYMTAVQKPAVMEAIWTLHDATHPVQQPDQTGLSVIDPAPPLPNRIAQALVVWGCVSGLLLLRFAAGWVLAGLLVRRSRPFSNRIVDNMVAASGIGRLVRVRIDDRLRVPATAGFVRPTIILPSSAADWSETRLRVVLAHELAHVRQNDWLWSVASQISCALYPFNPLVWLCARRFRIESEHAADQSAVLSGLDRNVYASGLVEIAAGARRQPASVVAMASSRNVESRVRAILGRRRLKGSAGLATVGLSVLTAAGACGALSAFRIADRSNSQQQGGIAMVPDGSVGWKGPLSVKVFDEGGRPAKGARICFMLYSNIGYGSALTKAPVVTDERGLCTVSPEDLIPTTHEPLDYFKGASILAAVAYLPGHGLAMSEAIAKGSPRTEIRLANPCRVMFQVLDAEGRPAIGVPLSVRNVFHSHYGDFTIPKDWRAGAYSCLTDSKGMARFSDIPEGWNASYEIDDEQYLPALRRQLNPEATSVTRYPTLHVIRAATIEGDVRINGKPFANARIQMNCDGESWSRMGTSDANGHYKITRVPNGVCDVHYCPRLMADPNVPVGVVTRQHNNVIVRAGQQLTGVDFTFEPGVLIRGKITNENGKPEELSVSAEAPDWVQFQHGIAGNPSDYGSTGSGDGTYQLWVAPGRYRLVLGILPNSPTQWIDARPGQIVTADFKVDMKSRQSTIGGCGQEE